MNSNRGQSHILILGRTCPHSREAHDIVTRTKSSALVKCVWVEDNVVKIPAYVTSVPFLVTSGGHKYVDDDLFFFLEKIVPTQLAGTQHAAAAPRASPPANGAPDAGSSPDDPMPYVSAGLEAGFSGAFAFIDASTDDGSLFPGNLQPVSDDFQTITTPKDDATKKGRGLDDSVLDKLRQQRERDVQVSSRH